MSVHKLTDERVRELVQALPALIGQDSSPGPLQLESESIRDLVADYFRLVEIAHYVRRGGVKAMIYRLDTGKTKFVPVDYFDEAHERLSARYREVYSPAHATGGPLIDRLEQILPEEEEAVERVLADLDSLLLLDKRLEAVAADEE